MSCETRIIKYESKYRDDLIFMVLEAKNALGRVPNLNADLLDLEGTYFDKGDMFWICVDENDRVIGSVGYSSVENSTEVWLHRLFIKANLKHRGIGTKLLQTAENHIISRGKTAIHIHLGEPKEQWNESRCFYLKHGYKYTSSENEPYMVKHVMNISFDFLSKADLDDTLAELFHILHGNMSKIAPTGETYEADKQLWTSSIRDALENPMRKIIVIKDKDETIGFFMYSISDDLLKMEEIQFREEYHGKGIFNSLFRHLFTLIPDNVKYVQAFANKLNTKSQGILTYLKLYQEGESKNGNSFRYHGLYENMKKAMT